MFQLSAEEFAALRSQFATLNEGEQPGGRGRHRKYLPYAFTEHGAIMAASVLNSPRAVEVSMYVVRAFVRLRDLAANHQELAKRLDAMEEKTEALALQHDTLSPSAATPGCSSSRYSLREMTPPPEPPKQPIGFVTPEEKKKPAGRKR